MKKNILLLSCLIIGIFSIWQITNVFAEQVGSSPSSGSTSRIKTLNDELVSLGVGSTATGAWGDWGTMWNRIYSAAIWDATLGDAVVANVLSGKKFYAGANRILLTGSLTVGSTAPDYSQQSLVKWDDYYATDETGEEASWTNTANVGVGSTLNVWKDNTTGLYWSASQGTSSNIFTQVSLGTCDFFATVPRGNYAGGDADCGNAINACGTLSLEAVTGQGAKTDWYLPTQKELMQAYLDGIYNQAGDIFTTDSRFWSSTEDSGNATRAWTVYLSNGRTYGSTKTLTAYSVRCVRRD